MIKEVTAVNQCHDDMLKDFTMYLDPFSAPEQPEHCVSYIEFKSFFEERYDLSIDECKCGLWIIDYPKIAYKALKESNALSSRSDASHQCSIDKFWEAVYYIIAKDKRFATPAFQRRNDHYKVLLDTWRAVYGMSNSKSKVLNAAMDNIATYSAVIRTLSTKPDNYKTFVGLIAPNGDFYSAGYGAHELKAYFLIQKCPDMFPDIENYGTTDRDNALDTIIKYGWCATRYLPSIGGYITVPSDLGSIKRVTKAQENAIFTAALKHNIKIDTHQIDQY